MWLVIKCLLQDYHDVETSRALLEFNALEDQLSGIEKYMIKYLETENAEMAALQLKQTDVCDVVKSVMDN